MAKWHEACRRNIEAAVPAGEVVNAVVLLMSITGGGAGRGSEGVAVNYENEYTRRNGLDPERRVKSIEGSFGLVAAQTTDNVHFLFSSGLLRRDGTVTLVSSHRKADVQLRHQRGGIPGLRQRLMHFTFADGQFYVGSSSDVRFARNAVNQPGEFVAAWGPAAIDNKAE